MFKQRLIKLIILLIIFINCCGHRVRDRPGMRFRQRLSGIGRNRTRNIGKVCYDFVGCFELPHPRSPLQRSPQDPNVLNTKFYLFNKKIQFSQPNILYLNDNQKSIYDSKFDYKNPLKVLIHGYMGIWNNLNSLNATDAYLKLYDCNVIIMDWSNGAKGPQYATAAANTEIVGRQLGILLNDLITSGLTPKAIHLIGFSLGAHVAGCASEYLKNKNILIGRITGLDAAGPLFRLNNLREKSKKLDRDDAIFVDALHTDSSPVFVDGFGLWEPIGHVDFFANGGQDQPGCTDRHPSIVVTHFDKTLTSDTACSHARAFTLFLETLNSKLQHSDCKFISYDCPGGLPSFEKGQCFPRLQNPNDPLAIDPIYRDDLGEFGENAKGNGVMYFATRDSYPFCGSQIQIYVKLSPKTPQTLGKLIVELNYDNDRPNFEINCELTDLVTRNIVLNKISATKYKSLNPDLKKMQVNLKYFHFEFETINETLKYSNEIIVQDVGVLDMFGNKWRYFGNEVKIDKPEGEVMLLKKDK
nr:pancreatic lipase-related protein 2-like [Onthophagus taurus]